MLRILPTDLYSMDEALKRLGDMLGQYARVADALEPFCRPNCNDGTGRPLGRGGDVRRDAGDGAVGARRVAPGADIRPDLPAWPFRCGAMSEERFQQIRMVEALIFASTEPVPEPGIKSRLPDGRRCSRGLMEEVAGLYANRGVNLVRLDGKWIFRTAAGSGLAAADRGQGHAPAVPCRAGDPGGHRLSPAGDAGGGRGGAGRRALERHAGHAAGDRLGPAEGPPPHARPPGDLGDDRRLPRSQFGLDSLDALPGVEELRAAGLLDVRSALSALGAQALSDTARPANQDNPNGDDADSQRRGGERGTGRPTATSTRRPWWATWSSSPTRIKGRAAVAKNRPKSLIFP